ncbi:MAG: hypothetical protein HY791_21255 [Deltaproteobacteria bacterium]|nr:hypothetical protein [Deltaproteobacteria bacterium]
MSRIDRTRLPDYLRQLGRLGPERAAQRVERDRNDFGEGIEDAVSAFLARSAFDSAGGERGAAQSRRVQKALAAPAVDPPRIQPAERPDLPPEIIEKRDRRADRERALALDELELLGLSLRGTEVTLWGKDAKARPVFLGCDATPAESRRPEARVWIRVKGRERAQLSPEEVTELVGILRQPDAAESLGVDEDTLEEATSLIVSTIS